jgi:hypothetical protein
MHEVHVFAGSAASLSEETTGYPAGERHALLVFLRQPAGSDHDWAAAEALVAAESWADVSLDRGGTIGPSSTLGGMTGMYDAAMANGGSIIIYSDPL